MENSKLVLKQITKQEFKFSLKNVIFEDDKAILQKFINGYFISVEIDKSLFNIKDRHLIINLKKLDKITLKNIYDYGFNICIGRMLKSQEYILKCSISQLEYLFNGNKFKSVEDLLNYCYIKLIPHKIKENQNSYTITLKLNEFFIMFNVLKEDINIFNNVVYIGRFINITTNKIISLSRTILIKFSSDESFNNVNTFLSDFKGLKKIVEELNNLKDFLNELIAIPKELIINEDSNYIYLNLCYGDYKFDRVKRDYTNEIITKDIIIKIPQSHIFKETTINNKECYLIMWGIDGKFYASKRKINNFKYCYIRDKTNNILSNYLYSINLLDIKELTNKFLERE